MSEIGHNSGGQLKALVERIQRLEEDKAGIVSDIKDVYAEAKGNGYDVPALREIVKVLSEDAEKKRKREEREAVVDAYKNALGVA
jgi:uncharacterized protein (UPF0335 family)